jgi:hypothetical protein
MSRERHPTHGHDHSHGVGSKSQGGSTSGWAAWREKNGKGTKLKKTSDEKAFDNYVKGGPKGKKPKGVRRGWEPT